MIKIKSFINSTLQSNFFKNTLILASGSTIAQGISFVFLIILQRWFFTPSDFGLLGLYVSISTLLTACSTLKFEYAIVIPKEDSKALVLIQLSFISVIFIAVASALILPWMKQILPSIEGKYYYSFTLLIPLTILFSGIYEILIYWNNRKGDFKKMSVSRIIQNSSMESLRLIFGLLQVNPLGLIFGRLFGQFTSMFYLGEPFFQEHFSSLKQINRRDLAKTFSTFRDFPLFTMPTVFISNFSNLVLIVFFFQYYGDESAGLISIAIQYIALPFGIISAAFSQVFYKKISSYDNRSELLFIYLKFAKNLGLAGLLIIILIYLVPDQAITYLIGDKWAGLTMFMKISVLWQCIAFVASSLSFIYTRLMKQRMMTLFALLQLCLVYLTLRLGNFYYQDAYYTFVLYVTGQCLYYCLTIFAAIYFIRRSKILI